MEEIKECKGGKKRPGCGKVLPLNCFRFRKDKNKYENLCQECEKQYQKQHHKEYDKVYKKEHNEEIKLYRTEYYQENKETINEKRNKYRLENPEITKAQKRRDNDKRMANPMNKLSQNFTRAINKDLKKYNISKNEISSFELTGYTNKDLFNHLEAQFEPWMTWENYGKYNKKTWNDDDPSTWKWQIDHINPLSDHTLDEFQECWDLSNLRPYSAKQNIIDGVTKIRHKK